MPRKDRLAYFLYFFPQGRDIYTAIRFSDLVHHTEESFFTSKTSHLNVGRYAKCALSLCYFNKYRNVPTNTGINNKYEILRTSVQLSLFIPCGQKERQTDMARLIVAFDKCFTIASEMKKLCILSYTCASSSCRILMNYFKYPYTQKNVAKYRNSTEQSLS